jgi:hypothetical protein
MEIISPIDEPEWSGANAHARFLRSELFDLWEHIQFDDILKDYDGINCGQIDKTKIWSKYL